MLVLTSAYKDFYRVLNQVDFWVRLN